MTLFFLYNHSNLNQDIWSGSESYTQHNEIIYIIWNNALSTFNMQTQHFISPLDDSTIPISVSDDGALTYIDQGDGYLCIVGGRTTNGTVHNKFQIFRLSDSKWFDDFNSSGQATLTNQVESYTEAPTKHTLPVFTNLSFWHTRVKFIELLGNTLMS